MKTPKEYQDFCKATLFPALAGFEERRKGISRKRQSLLLFTLILLVSQVIVALLGYIPIWTVFISMFIFPFLSALTYKHFFSDKDLADQVQDVVVKESIKFLMFRPAFDEKTSIPYKEFVKSKLFLQFPDNYEGRNVAKGKLADFDTLLSEIDCGYLRNVEGKSEWQTIFKGLFLIILFEKDLEVNAVIIPNALEKDLYLVGKQIQKYNFQREQKVPFDDDKAFSKAYVVYADKPLESTYLISPFIRDFLLNFKQQTGIEVSISFVGPRIYFAFATDSLIQLDLSKTILDFEQIKPFYLCLTLMQVVMMDISKRFIKKAGVSWSI
jgi:hypothetical protein